MILGTDNETCKLDISQGWSKGMKHLRKHHRVSISLSGEAVARPEVHLEKLESDENTMDIFTKPLGPAKFTKHRTGLDVR